MRSVYASIAQELSPTGATQIEDVRVPNGKVLVVNNMTIYWTGTNAADYMFMYYISGGRKFYVGRGVVGVTYCSGTVGGGFVVGENDRCGAIGNFTSTPTIVMLSVSGELWDAKCWSESV